METSLGGPSASKWMNQVAYPHNETLSSNKKEWNTHVYYNVGEPQKHYAKWNKPDIKDHVFYVFN